MRLRLNSESEMPQVLTVAEFQQALEKFGFQLAPEESFGTFFLSRCVERLESKTLSELFSARMC